ncbi:unnamed protein product [Heterobilharzia americana]|nr:unnamed protein product [Heterobilharzia americana]
MAETEEAVIIRRNIVKENNSQAETTGDTESEQESENDSKDVRLTLMEEVLLLGLKDREGYLSFWNDSVSCGLRGCILVELGLRNRIGLEPSGMRRRSLLSRCIVVKKTVPTGDALLDEALKHIKENKPENTKTWVEYLSGAGNLIGGRLSSNAIGKHILDTSHVVDSDIVFKVISEQRNSRLLRYAKVAAIRRLKPDSYVQKKFVVHLALA